MAYNEYTYRMKPVVIPGIVYLVFFPICLLVANMYFPIVNAALYTLFGIYGVTAVVIFCIWALAGTRRIIVDEHAIIISDMLSRRVFDPGNIQRIKFSRSSDKKKEFVRIRTRGYTALLSDFYTPYDRLLLDIENYIYSYNIRTNLKMPPRGTPRSQGDAREFENTYTGNKDKRFRGYANK
ncbi:MAG: hypothetical protein FWG14_05865 [Peptococcaceae bacterium]|nr:hypothetical protein [Peptococcaceae bacterium]